MPHSLLHLEAREILDALPEPVALVDDRQIIQYLNAAWQRVSLPEEQGAEAAYAPGRAFTACMSQSLGAGAEDEALLTAALQGERVERRGRVLDASLDASKERWLLTQVVPWGPHSARRVLVSKRDITTEMVSTRSSERYHEILKSVGFAASQFLGSGSWSERVARVLERFGQVTDVSRVYVFDARQSPAGDWVCSQLYEWCADGVTVEIDNPDLQNMPFEELGLGRWIEHLSRDEPIFGQVNTFPAGERAILEPQSIVSIVVVPIFVSGTWWGFLGFDECRSARAWSLAEIEALRAGAGLLGSAFHNEQSRSLVQERLAQEEVIRVQQEALRELEAPLIPVHEHVVVMPLVGWLDAARLSRVQEALLEGVAGAQPRVAILDMTGVRRLDAAAAEGLARVTRAARLVGVEVMLTGVRPDAARALVELGTELSGIATSLHLQAGISRALRERRR
ncbi:STAS domain-containing protein [Chondromyces crocatus]|uniref:STAS domain-containing protein n=1 Tax=Chondromyces crocatus TaxID=52 RepID=A0A0K1EQK0_CHOCO|nr:STAS domain-containing protein [Chondromyces crocatus]AKT43111.1 uncharacterized protein CMC5_073390 [Chondromyces crocatus]